MHAARYGAISNLRIIATSVTVFRRTISPGVQATADPNQESATHSARRDELVDAISAPTMGWPHQSLLYS